MLVAVLVTALTAGPRSSLTLPATRPYLAFSGCDVRARTSPTTARLMLPIVASARTHTSLSFRWSRSANWVFSSELLQTLDVVTLSQMLTCHEAPAYAESV